MKGFRLIAGLPVLVLAGFARGFSVSIGAALHRAAHAIAGIPCDR